MISHIGYGSFVCECLGNIFGKNEQILADLDKIVLEIDNNQEENK